MKQLYDYYKVALTAIGPVFIGAGNAMSKKEYILDNRNKKVIIPHFEKMYLDIKRCGLETPFQRYMLYGGKERLQSWLYSNGFSDKDYKKWMKYELDCGDAMVDKGKELEIRPFMKDAYGKPYIPGSSLKGMLRTILLAYDMMENADGYSRERTNIEKNAGTYPKRNVYLNRERRQIEIERFHLLERDREHREKMSNDIMSNVIVGDSYPLGCSDLTLCQKIDGHVDGSQRKLNILRECLKPGTRIDFELKIGRSTGISEEILKKAVQRFDDMYYNVYLKKFPKNGKTGGNTVWIGGGAGFLTKTVIYPMFKENERQAVRVTDAIFKNTLKKKYQEHKHGMYARKGMAPHVIKMTQYNGKLYQMGMAAISFQKMDKIL